MKKKFTKKLFSMIALLILPATLCGYFDAEMVSKEMVKRNEINIPPRDEGGEVTLPNAYIGFGYNIAGGVPIYSNDALNTGHPILDRNNSELLAHVNHTSPSKSYTFSETKSRFSDISKSQARKIDANLGFKADISSINVNADLLYDRHASKQWGEIAREEYSYYISLIERQIVTLSIPTDKLSDYLDPYFKEDILKVKNRVDAKNIFATYGTHLPNGYKLGGLMELTNYYAQKTSTYVRANDVGFKAQVEAGYQNMGADADFSFTEKYGSKDNNSYATNQYHPEIYGGISFPSLSIDHIFSKLGGLQEDYTYNMWLKSINKNKNLIITGIPTGSKLVPIWDLLPINGEYNVARKALIDEFNSMATDAYDKYYETNKDVIDRNIDNSLKIKTDFTYKERGFNYSTQASSGIGLDSSYTSSYIKADENPVDPKKPYIVKPDSYIYMDYDQFDFDGQDVVWSLDTQLNNNGSNAIRIIDDRNGAFRVESGDILGNFTVICTVNGTEVFKRYFKVDGKSFSGGSGTLGSPYFIATRSDFEKFASNPAYWEKGQYFKLISNLDFNWEKCDLIGGGDSDMNTNAFKGTFDGGFHTIKNFISNNKSQTIFFANYGEISNLNVSYDDRGDIAINNGTGMIAGIVGVNHGSGKINNCTVSNFNIKNINKNGGTDLSVENNDPTLNKRVYIGGICGYNMGEITNCSLKNSNIYSFIANTTVEYYMVGGICGFNKSSGLTKIDKCLVESSSFDITLDNPSNNESSVNVGGLIGRCEGTNLNITNCLVQHMSKTTSNAGGGFTIYAKNNAGWTKYPHRYVGGLVGCTKATLTFQDCIILDAFTMNNMYEYDNTCRVGLGCGFAKSASTFKTCVFETENAKTPYIENDKKSMNGVTVKAVISTEDYSTYVKNTSEVWTFDGVRPELNLLRVKTELLSLDYSKTKTKFALGEPFSYSDLIMSTTLTDGHDYFEKSLIVDFSNYDSSKNGNYPIFVTGLGVTKQYNVTVGESPVNHIYAEEIQDANVKYFTEDKTIDTSGIKVTAVSKNGDKKVLTYDPTGKDGFFYNIQGEDGLIGGKNIIDIIYKDLSCTFQVNAIDRIIKSVEIINKAALEQKVYDADTEIPVSDLANIEVKIIYENDSNPKIIKGSDCDFVYSRVNEGENTIHILYRMVHSDSFKVSGKFNVDMNLVNEFIRLVNEINTKGTMSEQFNVINKARAQLAKIDSRYYGEQDYQTAKTNLQTAIDNYNAKVDSINKGFGESIEIAESFNVQLAAAAGLTTLAVIVGFIIKKYLF